MVDGLVRCQLTGGVRVNNSHSRSGGSAGRVWLGWFFKNAPAVSFLLPRFVLPCFSRCPSMVTPVVLKQLQQCCRTARSWWDPCWGMRVFIVTCTAVPLKSRFLPFTRVNSMNNSWRTQIIVVIISYGSHPDQIPSSKLCLSKGLCPQKLVVLVFQYPLLAGFVFCFPVGAPF